jgi:hypothetical protein
MNSNLSKFFLIFIAAFVSISCFFNIQGRFILYSSELETKILDMIHSKNYTKKVLNAKKKYMAISRT